MSEEPLEFLDSPANDVAMSIHDEEEPFVEPEMGNNKIESLSFFNWECKKNGIPLLLGYFQRGKNCLFTKEGFCQYNPKF